MAQIWLTVLFVFLNLAGFGLLSRGLTPWSSVRGRWLALALGSAAGFAACKIPYTHNHVYTAIGFPLPAAAIEMASGTGVVGPLSWRIACFDVLLVAGAPLAVLIIVTTLFRTSQPSA